MLCIAFDNVKFCVHSLFFFLFFELIVYKHGKMGWSGSGRVNRVMGQTGHGLKWVILSRLKTGSSQSGCGLGWIDPYFSHEFFKKFFYKENNMYLSFRKLCNKLLDVKCIILNSPLILRMNSVKLINTYSIIL